MSSSSQIIFLIMSHEYLRRPSSRNSILIYRGNLKFHKIQSFSIITCVFTCTWFWNITLPFYWRSLNTVHNTSSTPCMDFALIVSIPRSWTGIWGVWVVFYFNASACAFICTLLSLGLVYLELCIVRVAMSEAAGSTLNGIIDAIQGHSCWLSPCVAVVLHLPISG